MKLTLILLLFLFPTFAFANDEGFFFGVFSFFGDIWLFFTETIPEAIVRFFTWLGTYLIYLKYVMIKNSLIFANSVATNFLFLIDIDQIINEALSLLPSDLKQVAVDIKFFESITLVIEAAITRFVYETLSF